MLGEQPIIQFGKKKKNLIPGLTYSHYTVLNNNKIMLNELYIHQKKPLLMQK